MKKQLSFGFAVASLLVLSACTRPEVSLSKITIKTPTLDQGNAGQGVALPANKKVCYGVNVTGSGITEATVTPSCSVKPGVFSGWVPEGSELIVEVPKGENRQFDLYVYLADAGGTCPAFSASQLANEGARVVPSGSAAGVSVTSENQTVKINLDFPGAQASIGGSCSTQAGLKAKLLSNGNLIDAITNNVLAGSSPTNEGAYVSPIADALQIGVISSGGIVNMASGNLEVPSHLFSVTRKPDTGDFYGLQHDGQIVKLTTGSSMSIVTLNSSNCPFQVIDCKVPEWMQSISAGYGQELYGLDHGGQVYQLKASGPTLTGTNVEPYVTQVSFY